MFYKLYFIIYCVR